MSGGSPPPSCSQIPKIPGKAGVGVGGVGKAARRSLGLFSCSLLLSNAAANAKEEEQTVIFSPWTMDTFSALIQRTSETLFPKFLSP